MQEPKRIFSDISDGSAGENAFPDIRRFPAFLLESRRFSLPVAP
jgi:hypothetical protein